MRRVVEVTWLEQTPETKLRDDQYFLARAIYCGEVDLATRLAQMSCDVGSLAPIDLSADSADGMYSWGDAASFEDERCWQATNAPLAYCPKSRYEPPMLPMNGWWQREASSVTVEHPHLDRPHHHRSSSH